LRRGSLEVETLIAQLREAMTVARLVGRSPAFLTAVAHLIPVARSGSAVLISGETGTGKELVARAVHYLSDRAARPFVAFNCGALPDSLLEDELFGHERGAYTGAHASRKGLVAAAAGGTLFLDEVDGLTPRAQTALLRLLQEKTFRLLGSAEEQRADVRVITATNADLDRSMAAGAFRTDLYYRLCVFRFHLPALRERPEDILLLAEHFLRKHALPNGIMPRLSDSARAALTQYDWPGNIRELENGILRAIHLSPDGVIEEADLALPGWPPTDAIPPALAATAEPEQSSAALADAAAPAEPLESMRVAKRRVVEEFEKKYLARLIIEHAGNVTRAAQAAGKERRELGKLLKKYDITPSRMSPGSSLAPPIARATRTAG
jgi:DNA-binding NtrC family response regulator